jgi:O-methyltransferase
MSLRLKTDPAGPAQEPLAEQLRVLMRQPEFAAVLVEALRGSPDFSGLFAQRLGMALQVPEINGALARAVVNAPLFYPSLAPGYAVGPVGQLFPQDASHFPPATYSPARAAQVWGQAFGVVMDFVGASRMEGDIYEFGTLHGYTARHFAMAMMIEGRPADTRLHLFDTFTGFPELTSDVDRKSYEFAAGWTAGACASHAGTAERVERMLAHFLPRERFTVNVGAFADTLTREVARRPATIMHIDCDLYESTILVLDRMLEFDLIQDGTVLIFDDFNCARANPEFGERRAMHETFDNHKRFACEKWFSYGWHGQICIVHERGLAKKRGAA